MKKKTEMEVLNTTSSKTNSKTLVKVKHGTENQPPKTQFIFRFLAFMKKNGQRAVIAVGLSLALATIIGGLCFDLTASQVAGWFFLTTILLFGLALIISLVAFLFWFLFKNGFVFITALILLLIVGCSYIFVSPELAPFADIGSMFESLFSFLDIAPF